MYRLDLLYATIEHPEARDRAELKDALMSLAELDWDFNGGNGEEYLWEAAKDGGYESNADYLFDTLDKEFPTDDRELIYEFLDGWVGSDTYYWTWDYKVLIDKDDNIQHIVLSVISGS